MWKHIYDIKEVNKCIFSYTGKEMYSGTGEKKMGNNVVIVKLNAKTLSEMFELMGVVYLGPWRIYKEGQCARIWRSWSGQLRMERR